MLKITKVVSYTIYCIISFAEVNIVEFMKHFRNNFQEHIIPKMHLLKHHIVPFIRTWRVGIGLMGEQGAESIHANINSITRRYSGIRNKEQQLLHVIKENHVLVSPTIRDKTPAKRRKKTTVNH